MDEQQKPATPTPGLTDEEFALLPTVYAADVLEACFRGRDTGNSLPH